MKNKYIIQKEKWKHRKEIPKPFKYQWKINETSLFEKKIQQNCKSGNELAKISFRHVSHIQQQWNKFPYG